MQCSKEEDSINPEDVAEYEIEYKQSIFDLPQGHSLTIALMKDSLAYRFNDFYTGESISFDIILSPEERESIIESIDFEEFSGLFFERKDRILVASFGIEFTIKKDLDSHTVYYYDNISIYPYHEYAERVIDRLLKVAENYKQFYTPAFIQAQLDSGTDLETLVKTYGLNQVYGLNYQGGTLFFLDTTEHKGKIVTPQGIGFYEWGCLDKLITIDSPRYIWSVPSNELGLDGRENTNKIVDECAEPLSAAHVVSDYMGGGYDDWYLPSLNDFVLMTNTISGSLEIKGDARLWTSTEKDSSASYTFSYIPYYWDFDYEAKSNEYQVFGVRDFTY